MSSLTHFDQDGAAHMVDVGGKSNTERLAVAEGLIVMERKTLAMIEGGNHRKGDVLGIARVAGIMASKRTGDLVPLCHPIMLSRVSLQFEIESERRGIRCLATVGTTGPTGVEIEALMAVQVALLTIYDMCKSVDRGMQMQSIRLLEKSGGRSGHWVRAPDGSIEADSNT